MHEDEPTSIENEVEKEPESEQENDIAHQIQSELEQDFPKEFEHADSAQPFQLQTKLAISLSKVVGSTGVRSGGAGGALAPPSPEKDHTLNIHSTTLHKL